MFLPFLQHMRMCLLLRLETTSKRVCVWCLETTNAYVFGASKRQTHMCLLRYEEQTRMCVECVWNVCGLCLLHLRQQANAYVFGFGATNAYVFGSKSV